MKPPCIIYATDIDISRDNGAGVNERAFVTAAVGTSEMVCVLPSPRFSFRFHHPQVEYVCGHYGSSLRYPFHVLATLIRLFELSGRYDIRAVATRLGVLPLAPLLFSWSTGVPLFLKTHSGYQPLDRLKIWDVLLPLSRSQRRQLRVRLINFVTDPVRNAVVQRSMIIDTPSPLCKEVIIWQSRCSPAKIEIIPNGTNAELFSPRDRNAERKQLGVDRWPFIVGYVGALNRDKRCIDYLVRTLAALRVKGIDARSLIIGEGPERPFLERLVQAEGLADRVRFTGFVPHDMVPRYMATFDIGVDLCAAPMKAGSGRLLYSAYSQKMAQYLACGIPVLAWDLADTRFLEENGIGFLAPLHDQNRLTEKLITALSSNESERMEIRQRAREYAVTQLSYKALTSARLHLWRAAAGITEMSSKGVSYASNR